MSVGMVPAVGRRHPWKFLLRMIRGQQCVHYCVQVVCPKKCLSNFGPQERCCPLVVATGFNNVRRQAVGGTTGCKEDDTQGSRDLAITKGRNEGLTETRFRTGGVEVVVFALMVDDEHCVSLHAKSVCNARILAMTGARISMRTRQSSAYHRSKLLVGELTEFRVNKLVLAQSKNPRASEEG